jgi:hypothetical protein
MSFLKNWLIWIVMGVIVLVLAGLRLFLTSSYIEQEEKSVEELLTLQKTVQKTVRDVRARRVPTKGDISQIATRLKEIQEEGEATAKMWENASRALDVEHNKDPEKEFAVFLLNECTKMCDKLAEDHAKLLGRYREGVTKYKDICFRQNHQLADVDKEYKTLKDTIIPWRQYLISKKIHEIVGKTTTEIENSYAAEMGASSEDEEDAKPEFHKEKQLRVVEYLGAIDFDEMKPSSFAEVDEEDQGSNKSSYGAPEFGGMPDEPSGRRGRRSRGRSRSSRGSRSGASGDDKDMPEDNVKRYYDAYPVSIEVIAHTAVVQKLLKNFMRVGDMVFVTTAVEMKPLTADKKSMSSGNYSMPMMGGTAGSSQVDMKDVALEIDAEVKYNREPPVWAKLSYEVYHFNAFELAKEAASGKKKKGKK